MTADDLVSLLAARVNSDKRDEYAIAKAHPRAKAIPSTQYRPQPNPWNPYPKVRDPWIIYPISSNIFRCVYPGGGFDDFTRTQAQNMGWIDV